MANGMEIMLKSMGIDLSKVEAIIKEIVDGIRANNERMARMEERLERIENYLHSRDARAGVVEQEQLRITSNG